MKKILFSLSVSGLIISGANAQIVKIKVCETNKNEVCRMSKDRKVSCYKTSYAENFQVCKSKFGYFICCETPGTTNSTFSGYFFTDVLDENTHSENRIAQAGTIENTSFGKPVNQSYINTDLSTK